MAITAQQLVAEIGADISGLEAGVAQAKRRLTDLENVSGQTSDRTKAKMSGAWAGIGASVQGALGRVSDLVDGVTRKMGSLADAAEQQGRALSLAVTLPVAGLLKAALGFDDLKERATIGFTAMTGSAQIAKRTIDDLQKFAVVTPFDFSGLLKDAQLLEAMGTQVGDILPDIQAIGDAVAKAGGSAVEVDHAALALSQMGASAHLTAQDMNQLVEGAHIPAWDLLAKAMGKTTAQVREMSEKGLIPGRYAAQALYYEMEAGSKGAMQKLGGTLMAAASNLQDAATQALGSLFKPLYDDASRVANQVAGILMQIKGYIEALPTSVKQKIADMMLAMASVGPVMLTVAGLARALFLLASPAGIAAAAIAGLTYYLLQHRKAAQDLGAWIQAHWGAIWTAATAAMLLFAGVGVARTIASLKPLGDAFVWVGRAAITGFVRPVIAGIVALAAAVSAPIWAVVAVLAALVAAMGAAYLAWRNNWLHFRDVVDTVVLLMARRIDGFLDLVSMLPGAVGQAAAGVKVGMDTLLSAPGGSPSQNLGKALGTGISDGFRSALGGLPAWMTSLFHAPDISGLMKQVGSVKVPNFSPAMPKMPIFTPAADKNAEKAAKRIADLYASQVAELDKATFLIGKNGKLAEVQADIRFGELAKLNRGEQAVLLTLAAQYDARKRQQDIVEALQKLTDGALLAGLSKEKQAIIEAAGGYREWLKLGAEAQEKAAAAVGLQQMNAAGVAGRAILSGLRGDIGLLGNAAAEKLGKEAAGGAEAFGRMLNVASDYGHSLAENITRAAAVRAFGEGVVGKVKDLAEQLWQVGGAARTGADEARHFFEQLQKDTGADLKYPGLTRMVDGAVAKAKELDTALSAKQLDNWKDDLARDIDAAKAKIAGTYDPAKAAVADWAASNQDAIDKLVAGGGSIASVLGQVADKFRLEAQADAAVKLRETLADVQRQIAQMSARSPFEAWKLGLSKDLQKADPVQLKQVFDAQKVLAQMTAARQMVGQFVDGLRSTIETSLADTFQHGFKGFFSSVVDGFKKMFQQIAVQYLTNQAMLAIIGAIGGVNLQGQLGMFGGARAAGGPVSGNVPYLIGERGPELFVPGGSGTVVPNHALAGAAGSTYNVTVNVQGGGSRDDNQRSGQQVAQSFLEEMQRAQRRNGR